jgi:2-methylcitrate dehydratase PrpD
MKVGRRRFLQSSAFVPLVAAQEGRAAETAAADVTRTLARYVVNTRVEDVPAAVRKEAARTLLNWTGCAIGGSRHETIERAIRALGPFSGPARSSVLGRRERFDPLHAAFFNGVSSHIFDFDDTHLRSIVHPAAPVAPAVLAWSEHQPVTGAALLHALILGAEVECRVANAVYPAHYDIGWHITGTVGPFGAAAAMGKLLGLDEQQMIWALGLAASQPVGLREMFGTMTKSFHPGRAANNGMTAALLAQQNYTSSSQAIEALRGWANVLSTARNYKEITGGLGEHFELSINSYKPFPCGVVIHPALDACLQLLADHKLAAAEIRTVDLRVHPLVLELTGKKEPAAGLESKFSIYHAVAAALVEGKAGEPQFSDEAVRSPAIIALRARVTATVDRATAEDQVRVVITMQDGRRFEKYIEHAIGSAKNPMSDRQLEDKFTGLAAGILPADRVRELIDLCWTVEKLPDASRIAGTAAAAV